MSFPVIDLNTPTRLVLEWGWLLVTNATFVVFVLLLLVFVLGITVREPGVRRQLDRARRGRTTSGTASTTGEKR